jgi:hypothetical protein
MTELKPALPGVKPCSTYTEQDGREILIAALRTARTRVQLLLTEMDEVGLALKFNMTTPELAVGWLHGIGASYYMNPDVCGAPENRWGPSPA